MRIAHKIKYLGIFLSLGLAAVSFVATAQDIPPPAAETSSSAMAAPDVPSPPPSPQITPPSVNTNEGLTPASVSGTSEKSDQDAKGMEAVGNKVSESVKGVVKSLSRTADEVTLDDLNSARQAVAKLEALIEIEKHLAELEKIRQDRESAGMAAAIPASALRPTVPAPSVQAAPVQAQPVVAMPPPAPEAMELSRIVGSAGRYSAVIKMSDGQMQTVSTGDHLSDGGVVARVTMKEVEIRQGAGKRTTLRLKNVGTVASGSSSL